MLKFCTDIQVHVLYLIREAAKKVPPIVVRLLRGGGGRLRVKARKDNGKSGREEVAARVRQNWGLWAKKKQHE